MTQLTPQQIDAALPELPSIARLIIARDLTEESELLAIDLDSKRQCGISRREAYQFIPDVIGLDTNSAAIYTEGYPIAVGMSAESWEAWLGCCEFIEDPGFVWLTCCQDGQNDDCISALSLGEKREMIAPPNEMCAFLADLIGFSDSSYSQGFGVVCRMRSEDWAAWLEQFEAAELDAETVALLCS